MLIVALSTVRTRGAAFAGTFAALALGVSVIATMTLVLAGRLGRQRAPAPGTVRRRAVRHPGRPELARA
jgi:hypothetical protein